MTNWIRRKEQNNLNNLQLQYHKMMKKSFRLAVSDKERSDAINAEALQLLDKIRLLEKNADSITTK